MSKGVTQSEFARLQKCDKAHISRLKSAGRLVLVEGKIDVDASRALLAQTAHPSYSKNAANLTQEAHGGAATHSAGKSTHIADFNHARARNETAKAELAEMESAKIRGSLVEAESVRLFAADLGATFRAALEVLPDRLASELVALQDVESIRAVLVENFEQVLADLSLKIEKGVGL
jgi:phage terminase Nu1 subunit (DNA packaging protein)